MIILKIADARGLRLLKRTEGCLRFSRWGCEQFPASSRAREELSSPARPQTRNFGHALRQKGGQRLELEALGFVAVMNGLVQQLQNRIE